MRVSPFRHLRIIAHVPLPAAFRSLSRLSSAPSAKASVLRPFRLDLACARRSVGSPCSPFFQGVLSAVPSGIAGCLTICSLFLSRYLFSFNVQFSRYSIQYMIKPFGIYPFL